MSSPTEAESLYHRAGEQSLFYDCSCVRDKKRASIFEIGSFSPPRTRAIVTGPETRLLSLSRRRASLAHLQAPLLIFLIKVSRTKRKYARHRRGRGKRKNTNYARRHSVVPLKSVFCARSTGYIAPSLYFLHDTTMYHSTGILLYLPSSFDTILLFRLDINARCAKRNDALALSRYRFSCSRTREHNSVHLVTIAKHLP